ncbi:hypothetical protein M1394_03530 [Candidatus Marsarchaeota archaeon]|nr:hypothetical protein [Candidatus Marsarchaeota archaeon]
MSYLNDLVDILLIVFKPSKVTSKQLTSKQILKLYLGLCAISILISIPFIIYQATTNAQVINITYYPTVYLISLLSGLLIAIPLCMFIFQALFGFFYNLFRMKGNPTNQITPAFYQGVLFTLLLGIFIEFSSVTYAQINNLRTYINLYIYDFFFLALLVITFIVGVIAISSQYKIDKKSALKVNLASWILPILLIYLQFSSSFNGVQMPMFLPGPIMPGPTVISCFTSFPGDSGQYGHCNNFYIAYNSTVSFEFTQLVAPVIYNVSFACILDFVPSYNTSVNKNFFVLAQKSMSRNQSITVNGVPCYYSNNSTRDYSVDAGNLWISYSNTTNSQPIYVSYGEFLVQAP